MSYKFLYSRTQFWFNLTAGGSVGHTAGVVRGLSELGEVVILSNDRLYGLLQFPQKILNPWLKKPYIIAELIYNLPYFVYLKKNIKDQQPDLIYHRCSGFSFATSLVANQFKVPLIIEYNGSERWMSKFWSGKNLSQKIIHPFKSRIIDIIENYNLMSSTLIVVVSDVSRDLLLEAGHPPSKILVNPNGVDPSQFRSLDQDQIDEIKHNLRIPKDKVVVGFSGTFGEWHGIPELAEAIDRINQDPYYLDRLFFVLFGDGKLRSSIQNKIGHYENILFTGTIPYEKMPKYLSICDILLSPHSKTPDGRKFFGSPTKLFEYMAMGKGIIASNLDQLGEVITHKHTGWLIEPGNIDGLVAGIKILSDNVDLRNALGKAARQEVLAHYTWSAHVHRTMDALKSMQSAEGQLF
jgi:glycosyltransferase involved in cell wall biosynthesis